MSDRFHVLQAKRLIEWILAEEQRGSIFGISKEQFFTPHASDPFRVSRYGEMLETPLGVASGPHTQLSQNLVAAWLCGARYLELKTVQTLDELEVTKPCIDAEDEGYNCEWSQELRLRQSFQEYLNAWITLHVLRHHFGWSGERGFQFNMSLGYNLQGVLNANVQHFLDLMQNCRREKEEVLDAIGAVYPALHEIEIPDCITDAVTLSTMHGCPPEEIGRIAEYLIRERKLHTAVKLNPTLLGAERLRHILNEQLGFSADCPDEAFAHDLMYEDALTLLRSLETSAQEVGVEFGIKLTNTLETVNQRGVLPLSESMHYMSGRALHPLSIALAETIQTDFDGQLDISFCGGVDCFNFPDVIRAGLGPVTVCTDLLKPGGYGRLSQYLEELRAAQQLAAAESIGAFTGDTKQQLRTLQDYAGRVLEQRDYSKEHHPERSIKTARPLTRLDCVHAPCVSTCPTHQNIPEYMYFVSRGDLAAAMRTVLATNSLPAITGMSCDHACQGKCTRLNYDDPLQIREVKRFVQENADSLKLESGASGDTSVAIVGAGPAGLSCAWYLALAGVRVEIFESSADAGGMARAVIPRYRLSDKAIEADLARLQKVGVKIHYYRPVTQAVFQQLLTEYDAVFVAAGAAAGRKLGVPGEELDGVWDALHFLRMAKAGKLSTIGRHAVVVGGGNSAMDAARTARRLVGEAGRVTILYRRTRNEMPAEREEIVDCLQEGVELRELVTPLAVETDEGRLAVRVARMRLGEPDASGRRRPEMVEGSESLEYCDTLVIAVGQQAELGFLEGSGVEFGTAELQTNHEKLYIGGDALRGPQTIIQAVADGRRVAERILRKLGHAADEEVRPSKINRSEKALRAARRQPSEGVSQLPLCERFTFDPVIQPLSAEAAEREAARCLMCDEVCDVCVTVCPNRANIGYEIEALILELKADVKHPNGVLGTMSHSVELKQQVQVLNLTDFCNECGNCQSFCPTAGFPALDKPRLCLCEESFRETEGAYLLKQVEQGLAILCNTPSGIAQLHTQGDTAHYQAAELDAQLDLGAQSVQASLREEGVDMREHLERMLEMHLILQALGAREELVCS